MTTKIMEEPYYEIKEILNPKLEKRLIINCLECPFLAKNDRDERCINCILELLYNNKKKQINSILIKKINTVINLDKIQFILDYFKMLNTLKKIFQKIDINVNKECIFSEFDCKIKSWFNILFNQSQRVSFLNPFPIYIELENLFQKKSEIYIENHICVKCKNDCFAKLSNLLIKLRSLEIIHHFNEFEDKEQNFLQSVRFFNSFFFGKPTLNIKIDNLNDSLTDKVLDEYIPGSSQCFKVKISSMKNMYEKKYAIDFSLESDLDRDYILGITNDVRSNLKLLELPDIIPLEELLKRYTEEAKFYLKSKYQLLTSDREKIAFISALKIVNLEKVFPLLEDNFIEEIFLDAPYDKFYLNHQKWGRCRTDIDFSEDEIERIKTFLRIYSGRRLDFTNPSVQVVLKNNFFNCRFSADINPIQVHKFALDIRKLNKNILNIQDLVKNETLNSTMAAFLYFLILHRINITCTGETDTGKTTLINALDLLTPKEFRKIYIENVIESLNESEYGRHQLKYQVDSLQEEIKTFPSKHNQIKNLLHRSPDLIYLGEILTKQEAEAMFHCLSAGLKGFQTIHSNSVRSLINRLLFHFKLNFSCLTDLGIIIFMKKSKNRRYISSISEINSNEKSISKIIRDIFQFDPKLRNWEKKENLFNLEVVKYIKEYEFINENEFTKQIYIYTKIFENFKNLKKIDTFELINFFDQLAFYSYQGLNEILSFWDHWKNSRGLN